MKPFDVAVGMGIPFRFLLALTLVPIWILFLVLAAMLWPHGDLANAILRDFPDYWHWIWHGKKKW